MTHSHEEVEACLYFHNGIAVDRQTDTKYWCSPKFGICTKLSSDGTTTEIPMDELKGKELELFYYDD